MESAQPPVPPEIAAQQQQQPPLRQFAQQGGMAGAQGAVAAAPAMQLVEAKMNEIAKGLEDVARIVVNERPELVPLLKPVVQGLAMFMDQIKAGQGAQGGPPPQPGQPPQGGDQGTQQQSAPQAPGGAAMGM